ncbi:unnamed protein product [Closterium sp. NIES-64]|nr:unnamed protein product [Closterium sp. NIES-64]
MESLDPGGPSAPLVADGAGTARARPSGGVVFTPLYGAHADEPLCYHLRLGRLHLLLDCGWTDLLDTDLLEPLRAVAPAIHAVLLSHPDMEHAGALPYAYAQLGLRAPVYCTVPVARLAQLMLYDQFLARRSAGDFDLFSLDDVDAAFDGAVRLKFAQPHAVGDERDGVSVTPLAAGHLLGGTIWRISVDTEDLVYAVGFNHREERILGRAVLDTAVVRPAVLIADAATALVPPVKRKARDQQLAEAISSTVGEGGSVLMPVDTGGRVLELLVHLEQLWAAQGWEAPVVVATGESYSMVEGAKAMLEWLNPSTARHFDAQRTSPFNFKYIRLCHSVEEVEEVPGPKVVLASLASLEAGFARALFVRWAPDLRNTLLFTSRAPPSSLAHTLQTNDVRFPVVSVSMSERVPLEGEELRAYEEQQRQQQQAAMDAARGDEGDDGQGDGEEGEGEREGEGGEKGEAKEEADGEVLDGDDAEPSPLAQRPPSDVFCEGFSPLPLAPFPRTLPRHAAPRPQHREGWVAGPVFPWSEGAGGGGRCDEYGEVVDADGLAAVVEHMRGPMRPTVSAMEAAGVDMAALAEAEDVLAGLERPSRVRVEHVTVHVNCAIRSIDYEGLADGRSLRTMLAHTHPLSLVVVHGTEEGTAAMQQAGICSDCMAPRAGESIDLTPHLATFRVKLSDDLLRGLPFHKLRDDYEVAFVEGRLHPSSCAPPSASLSLLPRITGPPLPAPSGSGAGGQGAEGEEKGQGEGGEGGVGVEGRGAGGGGARALMELVPLEGDGEEAKRRAVMVGDVKLSEFKVLLQAQGLQAGFVESVPVATAGSAVLKCGDSLALRKPPSVPPGLPIPAKLVPVIPAPLRARLLPAAMASAAFPALSSTVAPAPSALWSANLTVSFPALPSRRALSASPICMLSPLFPHLHALSALHPSACSLRSSPIWAHSPPAAPYPTNAPWQNFVLGQGSSPELVTPYMVQSAEGRVAWGLPVRDPQPGYIVQAFVTALMLSTLQGLPPHQLSAYDDLSATLSFRQPSSAPSDPPALEVPLVRGSPFLTFIFPPGGPPATPMLTTIHAITGVEASSDSSKYRVALNNGQTWLVYLSSPLALRQDGAALVADAPFTGTMRVALLPGTSPQDEEAVLDAHVPTVPVGGSAHVGEFSIEYTWRTQHWRDLADRDTEAPLLMLSLPMHRRMEVSAHSLSTASALRRRHSGSPSGVMGALRGHHNPASAHPSIARGSARGSSVRAASVPDASVLAYPSIDGQAGGMQGAVWRLSVPKRPCTWEAGPLSSDAQLLDELRASLKQDVAALPPLSSTSTYSFGKAAARAARLALVAKQVEDEDSLAAVLPPLRTALSAWLDGTFPGNRLLYDPTWGGVVSEAGSRDQGAEFGAGMYNDHHFHYGYFIYAAATVAQFDSAWRDQYGAALKDLMADYMSPERTAAFPRLRHFDAYALHSWASGLFEFGDGRNQESFSEAVNAYYAGALLASVLGDQPLATLGATLAAVEALAGQTLMHVPLASSNPDPSLSPGYEAVFADGNRVVGVLWSTKRDAALWFAPPADMEKRVGIQVLPVSPFLKHLFPDPEFAKQLVEWAQPVLSGAATDEWRGFAWALQALYDPQGARANIAALGAFDDGNSKTNMLWWLASNMP